MPITSSSYSSVSWSASASQTQNGKTRNWGHRSAREVFRDEDNSKHERSLSQNLGEAPVYEEKHFDSQGRQLLDSGYNQQEQQGRRIEDVSGQK